MPDRNFYSDWIWHNVVQATAVGCCAVITLCLYNTLYRWLFFPIFNCLYSQLHPTISLFPLIACNTNWNVCRCVQVQWSDGRSTFTQIAALATDPRAYYLQGGCTDVQNSYIFNAIISLRPTPMTSSRPSRSVNTQRLQTQRTCSLVGLSNSTGALSLSPHQQCGTHCPTIWLSGFKKH